MNDRDSRTIKLIGEEGLSLLKASSVLIVGVGGVGSYAAEAVARAGVGRITLMDGDIVQPSNLNRQLVALTSTLGRNKAEVMAERIRDINPEAEVTALARFYEEDDALDLTEYDWIIDAIDSVIAKTALIKTAVEKDVNIVSAMGAAGKFDTQFKVADISKTSTCPLAKVMRKRLRETGIEHLPVVYSEEKPVPRDGELGTLSYVPGSAGLCLAGYVIRSIAVQ
ncbi:MAG: tRNA threonylcarbamoyladenosine dehydratase [Mogibacterium sp.]|nr:tRNA threonylcarbamoyladenosine dehydratase [Mogibacterium sp.]MBR2390803.1 tRNA threonylcarbamoyladenosine dehydratase [Mogibacterium sp.]